MTGHYCKKSNFLNDYVVKCPFETFITIRSTLLYLISEKVVNSVVKTVIYVICMVLLIYQWTS